MIGAYPVQAALDSSFILLETENTISKEAPISNNTSDEVTQQIIIPESTLLEPSIPVTPLQIEKNILPNSSLSEEKNNNTQVEVLPSKEISETESI